MKTLKEIKKEYQEFIDTIPHNIEILKRFLEKDKFWYDPEEIDEVQKFYEKNIKIPGKLGLTEKEFENVIATYFGVAHLWHFGGKWELETSKNSFQYGEPCLVEFGGRDANNWVSTPPMDWVYGIKTKQLDETIGGMFRRIINYHQNNPEFILDPVRNIQ